MSVPYNRVKDGSVVRGCIFVGCCGDGGCRFGRKYKLKKSRPTCLDWEQLFGRPFEDGTNFCNACGDRVRSTWKGPVPYIGVPPAKPAAAVPVAASAPPAYSVQSESDSVDPLVASDPSEADSDFNDYDSVSGSSHTTDDDCASPSSGSSTSQAAAGPKEQFAAHGPLFHDAMVKHCRDKLCNRSAPNYAPGSCIRDSAELFLAAAKEFEQRHPGRSIVHALQGTGLLPTLSFQKQSRSSTRTLRRKRRRAVNARIKAATRETCVQDTLAAGIGIDAYDRVRCNTTLSASSASPRPARAFTANLNISPRVATLLPAPNTPVSWRQLASRAVTMGFADPALATRLNRGFLVKQFLASQGVNVASFCRAPHAPHAHHRAKRRRKRQGDDIPVPSAVSGTELRRLRQEAVNKGELCRGEELPGMIIPKTNIVPGTSSVVTTKRQCIGRRKPLRLVLHDKICADNASQLLRVRPSPSAASAMSAADLQQRLTLHIAQFFDHGGKINNRGAVLGLVRVLYDPLIHGDDHDGSVQRRVEDPQLYMLCPMRNTVDQYIFPQRCAPP